MSIPLKNISMCLLVPIFASTISGLIMHLTFDNLLYINYFRLIITIIFALILGIIIIWIEKSSHNSERVLEKKEIKDLNNNLDSSKRVNKEPKILILGLIFVIFFIICYLYVYPYLFPPFEITEPEDGDSVGMICTIHGHGAIPGSSVKVYIEDGIGNEWLQNTVSTTRSGDWESERVIFGRATSDDIGKNFTIYATSLNKNNEVYETPHVTVTRS